MSVKAVEVIKVLMKLGSMATINQALDQETGMIVVQEMGHTAKAAKLEDPEAFLEDAGQHRDVESVTRPPVVTVMGHVDHGKTSLLDYIRTTKVAAGEAGGITQHIGAYHVETPRGVITFLDTPGHEAFTAMRARGAGVTDIVVLVVAVNKIDKDDADPNRVRTQLVERGVVPSEWGGDYEFVDVSAKTKDHLNDLLDTILVVADLEELTGDPSGHARGTVLEAHLDKGRGPVATVLVQRGTLAVRDALVAGTAYCQIRAMQDENGRAVDVAGPSKPVQILGWSHVPSAGDDFREVEDEREARHIAEERESRTRQAELVTARRTTLDDLMRRTGRAEVVELNLIVKADVQGSVQALEDSLLKLPQDEVRVNIVRAGAGGITENDVTLAMASDAIIVGFNVRPSAGARELAEDEGVEIRTYKVIYDAIDDIKTRLSGLLRPEEREQILGEAEVRQTFRVPKLGLIAGSYVRSGTIPRNASVRLVRDGVIVYEGRIASLRRFKDDVGEVREGFECGIGLENFQDVKEGDVIEAFRVDEVARSI